MRQTVHFHLKAKVPGFAGQKNIGFKTSPDVAGMYFIVAKLLSSPAKKILLQDNIKYRHIIEGSNGKTLKRAENSVLISLLVGPNLSLSNL